MSTYLSIFVPSLTSTSTYFPGLGNSVATSSICSAVNEVIYNDSKIEDFVIENTLGNGADIAIEAVGNPDLVAKCIEIVKPKGQVLMIGVSPDRSHLPVNLYEMHYREIVLKAFSDRLEAIQFMDPKFRSDEDLIITCLKKLESKYRLLGEWKNIGGWDDFLWSYIDNKFKTKK